MIGFAERLLRHFEREGSLDALTDEVLSAIDQLSSRPHAPLSARAELGGLAPPFDVPGVEWIGDAFHPRSTADVQQLVDASRQKGRRLRVAGARHSTSGAVFSQSADDARVVLDGDLRQIGAIEQHGDTALVWVGGGCYLGINPEDPSSTADSSLNRQLDAQGWALPVLGGISHQSVAGFMQTGSAGGSLRHGFADAVESIELVDGTGKVVLLTRGSDEFAAAGVAVGLLGVLTRVRLRVERRYFVDGTEANHTEDDSFLRRSADGYPLAHALQAEEYLHLNWYPQAEVHRVTQWIGRRCAPTATPVPYSAELKSGLMNALAALVLWITSAASFIDANGPIAKALVGALLRKFVSLDRNETFRDVWYLTLPCDDQVRVDSLIKVIFTEIWLPLDQVSTALDRLKILLTDQAVAGNFAVELYGAKQSPFWLSPSWGHDVVRVDVFWWAYNLGDPRERFAHFWDTLLELDGARLHWGKHLPDVGQRCGKVIFDANFLRHAYPRFDAWLTIRRAMDPAGVFASDYWARLLGL